MHVVIILPKRSIDLARCFFGPGALLTVSEAIASALIAAGFAVAGG